MNKVFLTYEVNPHHLKLYCKGQWTLQNIRAIEKELMNIPTDKKITCDLDRKSVV